MGPMPPLLLLPTETQTKEAEIPQQHMLIRALLEVRPETNAVHTITLHIMTLKNIF